MQLEFIPTLAELASFIETLNAHPFGAMVFLALTWLLVRAWRDFQRQKSSPRRKELNHAGKPTRPALGRPPRPEA